MGKSPGIKLEAQSAVSWHLVTAYPAMDRLQKVFSSDHPPASSNFIGKKKFKANFKAREPRALAASSSLIALSMHPSPCDDSEPSKESILRVAYGGAKIAIDIVKESSDMFLPLKAVVGAVAVLIKNFDVRRPQVSYPINRSRFSAANRCQHATDQGHRRKDTVTRWGARCSDSRRGQRGEDAKGDSPGVRAPIQRNPVALLTRIYCSQGIGKDRRKAQTVVRTMWSPEILKQRRSGKHFKRIRPRSSQCRHGLSSMSHEHHLVEGLMRWTGVHTTKPQRGREGDQRGREGDQGGHEGPRPKHKEI